MASFEVKLKDGTTEMIDGADAYKPDGQLTSFFALAEGREIIDCWSVRVASIRTSEIVAVRRQHEATVGGHQSDAQRPAA